MNYGINARRLAGQRLGVGRYIEYMVRNWDHMLQPTDSVSLYVQQPVTRQDLRLSEKFNIHVLRPRLTGLLWENLLLPQHGHELNVLFCPSYTAPLRYAGRTVVAIHSLNEAQKGTHPWWYQFTYRQIYRLSARKADIVIVPSESTKEDIQAQYSIPADKIEVIPQGVDDSFRPIEDEAILRATRQRHVGDHRPYILFVGKLSQRRNIPVLLTAFSMLKKRMKIPHRLLLVGPNHLGLPLEQMASELEITDSLIQTDGRFNDHRELIAIYSAADLYVNASLYEGFSLTLVEALACGVPVVTVNRAALREIAGTCALMVEEPTVEALADAIYHALTDRPLRETMRAKGLERARSFRYEDTARRTLEVLSRVAQNNLAYQHLNMAE